MKFLAKVIISILTYNALRPVQTEPVERCGYRTKMEASRIPNNGGL